MSVQNIDLSSVNFDFAFEADPTASRLNFVSDGGRQTVRATNGNDRVDTGAGDDTIYAGNGLDTVFGGTGNDTVLTGRGRDTVFGGDGDDTIFGELGDDLLYGGAGRNTLVGGGGSDILVGGDEFDSFNGGRRSDTFVLNHEASIGGYIIDLSAEDFVAFNLSATHSIVQSGSKQVLTFEDSGAVFTFKNSVGNLSSANIVDVSTLNI